MALMALDDDNVRTTRGDVPMDSDELASQPTPPASSSMLGYVAKGIQDFLGATPSLRDKETADASMETQVALEQQGDEKKNERQDQPVRFPSSASSLRRTDKDDEEQFGGIPIPEEGNGYGMTEDEDDSDELDLTVMSRKCLPRVT